MVRLRGARSGEAGQMPDRQSAAKAMTKLSAKLESRKSPVSKQQDTVPIANAMAAFHERDTLSFGIPAHNGGRGPAPEFTRWASADAARCDLPMSHGVDTRDRAWKVQSTAEELFAEAVGADQTLFSTNGSSMNVHVALLTVAGPARRSSWRATRTSRRSPAWS
jgi:arginine decarboxylase